MCCEWQGGGVKRIVEGGVCTQCEILSLLICSLVVPPFRADGEGEMGREEAGGKGGGFG